MEIPEEIQSNRKTDHPIHPLIESRWSPRAMAGESISNEELMSLFEAARCAPSSFNNQPWCFLYAKRDTKEWDTFFSFLTEFNQAWTKNAAVLLVIASNRFFTHNHKPSRTHSFDTGAAWMSLALEGCSRGLVVHGMEGFDYDKAKQELELPEDYNVEAMVAIGKKAPITTLSKELQEKEIIRPRKPITDFIMNGKFTLKS